MYWPENAQLVPAIADLQHVCCCTFVIPYYGPWTCQLPSKPLACKHCNSAHSGLSKLESASLWLPPAPEIGESQSRKRKTNIWESWLKSIEAVIWILKGYWLEIWTLKKNMQRLCANKFQSCTVYILMCSKLGLQISSEISSDEKGPRHLETETIREPNCHSAGLMRTTCDIMQRYTSLHIVALWVAGCRRGSNDQRYRRWIRFFRACFASFCWIPFS